MTTISVQQMPNGYELETPSFWYWMKAGMAFTLGAAVVGLFAWIASVTLSMSLLYAWLRTPIH